MTAKKDKPKNDPIKFEETLKKLEAIETKMQDESTSLQESLDNFEEGVRLTRVAQKTLLEAEQRLKILTEKDGDLSVEYEPVNRDKT